MPCCKAPSVVLKKSANSQGLFRASDDEPGKSEKMAESR
jgi:hypothetical protein